MPVPSPKKGESRDKFVSRCISTLKKRDPDREDKQIQAMCYSAWRKEGVNMKENVPLKFSVPFRISESKMEEPNKNERKLEGTLLYATTSRNGITYTVDEINGARFGGKTLADDMTLTMSLNHTDDVTDNVGLWKPVINDGEIQFEAKVYNTGRHSYVTEMIDKGLIRYVSVEALAKQLEEDGDEIKAMGLDITGMGLVKTPGIEGAYAAIAEAFKNSKKDSKKTKEVENMTEKKKPEEEPKDKKDKKDDKDEKDEKDEKDKKNKESSEAMIQEIKKLGEKLDLSEKLLKKVEELEKKLDEKKAETKGKVTEETAKPKYKMVKEKNNFRPGTINVYAKDPDY